MALRFCDSFDHYVTADLLSKWTSGSNINRISVASGSARLGANGLTILGTDTPNIYKQIDNQATWIVGCAARFSSSAGVGTPFIRLLDSGSVQMELGRLSDGRLTVLRNGTTLGTSTNVISFNRWYYVEFKVTIHNSTGIAVVKMDGAEWINLSGQDTQATANATANQIQLDGRNGGWDVDDLYVCDGTGGTNNDFLGDVRVETILPSGNGNSSVFVGSDGNSVDNYLLVDETAPNGDTDYVQASNIGDKDTYAFGNVTPTTGTVYGLQILQYAKKTDAGSRSIASVARLSGTEVDSANLSLSMSYVYLIDIRETKPGGGSWSISDVNASEFGPKVTV